MRAVGHAGERRRVDLVPFPLERVSDAAPAPAAVPGAVNQDEGFWRRLGFTLGTGLSERAGGGQNAKRSAARRFDGRQHGNLLPVCFYFRGITTSRRRPATPPKHRELEALVGIAGRGVIVGSGVQQDEVLAQFLSQSRR